MILDYLNDYFYVDKINNLMEMYGAEQIITKPACYVVTNHKNVVAKFHDCPKITNHFVLRVNLGITLYDKKI